MLICNAPVKHSTTLLFWSCRFGVISCSYETTSMLVTCVLDVKQYISVYSECVGKHDYPLSDRLLHLMTSQGCFACKRQQTKWVRRKLTYTLQQVQLQNRRFICDICLAGLLSTELWELGFLLSKWTGGKLTGSVRVKQLNTWDASHGDRHAKSINVQVHLSLFLFFSAGEAAKCEMKIFPPSCI